MRLTACASWKNRCASSVFCASSGWRNLIATGAAREHVLRAEHVAHAAAADALGEAILVVHEDAGARRPKRHQLQLAGEGRRHGRRE